MPGPLKFDAYLGWVNITDPNNIPQDARVVSADDLLRYENLGVDAKAKFVEQDALLADVLQTVATFDSDAALAEKVSLIDSATRTAVKGMVGTLITDGVEQYQEVIDAVPGNVAAQVPPLVATAIASDATITAAASLAVDDKVADLDLLEGGDILEPEFIFAVTDEDGRRTVLELGADGNFTTRAKGLIADGVKGPVQEAVGLTSQNENITDVLFGVVDEDGRRTELEVGLDGRLTERVVASLQTRMSLDVSLPVPAAPVKDLILIGHSMLAGASGAISTAVAGSRGSYSISVGGEGMGTISGRWGSHPSRITFAGGEIPASGSVNITLNSDALAPLAQGASTYAVTVILNDGTLVPGTFGGAVNNYTFTRATAGSVIPVTRPVVMRYDVAESRRDRIAVFWAARNGTWNTGNVVRERLDRMEGMIRHLNVLDRRFLVLSEHWQTPDATDVRAAIADYNRQALLRWGGNFIDTQQYLIDYGLSDRNITPTTQDTADIAAGIVPTSLRGDNLHLNTEGNAVIGALVNRRLIEKGW